MSLKIELMTEQKRVRNMCCIIVRIFYRPLGHKKEMEGCFPSHYLLWDKGTWSRERNLELAKCLQKASFG